MSMYIQNFHWVDTKQWLSFRLCNSTKDCQCCFWVVVPVIISIVGTVLSLSSHLCIVTWWLKEKAIARKRLDEHGSATMNQQATIEKLLGHLLGNAPFSIRSMPRYVRRTRRIWAVGYSQGTAIQWGREHGRWWIHIVGSHNLATASEGELQRLSMCCSEKLSVWISKMIIITCS